MEDKVFGTVMFDHGWVKKENITLWNRQYQLDIRTSSYANQMPTLIQQEAYLDFRKRLNMISDISAVKICQFISQQEIDGVSTDVETLLTSFQEYVKPDEVLFFQDGSYAIICNTDWWGEDIAVLISGRDIVVDSGYMLEFRV